MEYVVLGRTGLQVNKNGFGALPIQRISKEEAGKLVKKAFENGINYFDTARAYSDSEEKMGAALADVRDQVIISTKTAAQDAKEFWKDLEESLTKLQTDYIDFYHMWCMLNLESWERHMEVIYRFFEEAKAEGLIRNIVFSSHMEGNDIEKVVETGKFKGMLIGYNALNYRFRQSGIEAAHAKGMGIVVMNPLGGGMIPQNPEAFSYLTERTDLTVPQAALRFVASHKEITITLAGCTTKAHVDDAVKAVENLEERPAKEIVKLYEDKGVALNNLCTGCAYCKGCPKEIEIPKFMDAYNQQILTGKETAAKERLNNHWGLDAKKAAECIACGKCERACTQHLPIIERLKEIALK